MTVLEIAHELCTAASVEADTTKVIFEMEIPEQNFVGSKSPENIIGTSIEYLCAQIKCFETTNEPGLRLTRHFDAIIEGNVMKIQARCVYLEL